MEPEELARKMLFTHSGIALRYLGHIRVPVSRFDIRRETSIPYQSLEGICLWFQRNGLATIEREGTTERISLTKKGYEALDQLVDLISLERPNLSKEVH